MTATSVTWATLLLLYVGFFGWYTSCEGPLTPEEIARYEIVLREMSDSPDGLAKWRTFMESDTGDDFVMLNAIEMRATPTPGPGIEPGETSDAVLARYTRPFLARALRSAAHPVLGGRAAAPALDTWGIAGAEEWTDGGLVRYRSRRDLLEQIVALRDADGPRIHAFKIAAMEKTIAFPLDPWFQLGDPRLVLALVFVVVGLAVQLARARASARSTAATPPP